MATKDYVLFTTICWWLIGMYWLINAQNAKPTLQRQNVALRWIYVLLLTISFTFLFAPFHWFPWLSYRLLPAGDISGIAGSLICAGGIAFAIWARYILGTNWSGAVTVKENHELIRKGPYAIVRHPIYTGALTAMIGTACVTGELKGFLAVIVCTIGFLHKLSIEEQFMLKEFPDQYPGYRKEVKMLVPYIL